MPEAAQSTTVDPGAPGAQQDATGGPWFAGLDDETKGWVQGKQYDKLDAAAVLPELVKGFRGAESKLGVPADQLVRKPKDENDAEGFKAAMKQFGAPDTPEGYELPMPDGQTDDSFLKKAGSWFHELNVPKNIAKGLASKWNAHVQELQEQQNGEWNARFDTEVGALKAEWKDGYDANVDLAKRVMRSAGWSGDQLKSMEKALGPKAFLSGFAKFGQAVGEHRFVGEGGQQGFGGMTPEAARDRIKALSADSKWMESYMGGDADKKAEFTRLHQVAFPEPKVD